MADRKTEKDGNETSEKISRPLLESLDTGFRFLRWIVLVVVVVYLFSNTSVIKSDEVAMVLRFGRLVGNNPGEQVRRPGLLFALPRPIDKVVRVRIKRIYELEIQDLHKKQITFSTGEKSMSESLAFSGDGIDPEYEGYCLTGDKNVVQAYIVVKYQIDDPIAFAFRQEEPEKTLRDAMMAAMTRSVGEMTVDSVLTEGKKQLATIVTNRAQASLDGIQSGLTIQSVEFNELVPSRYVMQDFKNVQNAYIDKETKTKEAQRYKEEELPKAEAEKEALLREADAYSAETLSKARGEADAFRNLVTEYRKNPKVVRERIYREAMEGTIGWSGRAVVIPVPVGTRYDQLRIVIPGK
ncbi:FtsH protease activity modulator HflK [bacterium]